MSPIEAAVLRSIVAPSAVFGLFLLGTGTLPVAWRTRAQATGLGLAFVAGAYLLLFSLSLPPANVNESLSFVALVLAAFAWIAPRETGPRYLTRALVTLGCVGLVLFHIRAGLTGSTELRNLIAFACLSLGTWSITETAAHRVRTTSLLVTSLISATTVSLVCLLSGSAVFAQLTGVLCGLLGAGFAVSIIWPKRVADDAFVPFASVFVTLVMTAAHFYLDVNPWRMIATAWPFAVLWLRPKLPISNRAVIETPALALLAGAPMAYFLYSLFRDAGPLY